MSTSVVGTGRQPAATHTHSPRYVVGTVPSTFNNGDDAGDLEAADRSRIPTGLSWAPRDPTSARGEPNAGGLAATGAP